MRKKKTTPPVMPDQPLLKERVEPETFIQSARRLLASDDFKLLRRYWAGERIGIIENVKRKRDPIECAVLDGFDRAISVVEIWAHKTTGDEIMRQRHAELMQQINGETK